MSLAGPPSAALHRTFRAVLQAMSRPGVPHAVPDASTDAELVHLVVQSIHEPGSPVGLGGGDEARGALPPTHRHITDISLAEVVIVGPDPLPADILAACRGTEDVPQDGATLVVLGSGARVPTAVRLDGPGIPGELRCSLPLDRACVAARSAACAEPPMGVDLLFVRGGAVVGLPRSTAVRML